MKGPYERLKYELQRVWECPLCKHRERTDGTTTYVFCHCQADPPSGTQTIMKLLKDGTRRINGPAGARCDTRRQLLSPEDIDSCDK